MVAITTLTTSLALSADAFAASVARGTSVTSVRLVGALKTGSLFGTSEGMMCLVGWALAHSFGGIIDIVDHWIALALLCIVGVRMVLESLQVDDLPGEAVAGPQGLRTTLLTAIGTSIDAAAVGVTFALAGIGAWVVLLVGTTSFAMSTAGCLIAPRVESYLGRYAEAIGGLVLIAIGISIFVDHTILA